MFTVISSCINTKVPKGPGESASSGTSDLAGGDPAEDLLDALAAEDDGDDDVDPDDPEVRKVNSRR